MIKNININTLVNILKKYKIYLMCILIIVMSIVSIIIQDIDRKNSILINSESVIKKENKIAVYVTGEVKNPGVYYMDQNSRLYNLIDISGGTTENADISKLNLALKLNDSDKIIIPIKTNNTQVEENLILEESYDEDKININTAGIEELMDIPGIGEATANKIIEYRKNNYFNNIEDIKNVSGIGEAKFNSLKDKICVE